MTGKNGTDFEDDNLYSQQTMHYKDAAILRFSDEIHSVKVVNESEFINEFRRRNNDPLWKSLECIQTCIKSRFGLGKHFFVDFKP